MGSKGKIKLPEAYDLEELIQAQVKMNRFDSDNPFGSQTWETMPDGRMKMTQSLDPKLQEALDKQFAFANRDAPQYRVPPELLQNFNGFAGQIAERAGMGGGFTPMGGKPQPSAAPPPQGPAQQAPAAPPPAAGPAPQLPPQQGGYAGVGGGGFSGRGTSPVEQNLRRKY